MTTIAWDGKTLAGDKLTTDGSMNLRSTKVFRIGDLLVGGCGNAHRLREMHEWVANGRRKEDLPAFQLDEKTSAPLLVIEAGKILFYEVSHVPLIVENPFYAMGSGRDFAMAAMHLGLTAAQAVEVAAQFDTGTGNGVDVVSMDS